MKTAIVIGVSNYPQNFSESQCLKHLPKAISDAQAIHEVLNDPKLGAFNEVILKRDPGKNEMENAINQAFNDSRTKNDLVLLYFSGHGIKDLSGKFYLTSAESYKQASGDLYKASVLSAAFCHDLMLYCPARRKVIILDCCLSAAFADGMPLAKDAGVIDLKSALGGEGVALLSSSDSTELSYEHNQGEFSVYTNYLLEGIRSGAADLNKDGFIDVQEAHDYAAGKTREEMPAMNPRFFTGTKGKPIMLTKAPRTLAFQHYQQEVERVAGSRGEINQIDREILNCTLVKEGLSKDEAQEIEKQVLTPLLHRTKNLATYQNRLEDAWSDGKPNTDMQCKLDELQKLLGLQDEDIAPLLKHHTPLKILPQVEEQVQVEIKEISNLIIYKNLQVFQDTFDIGILGPKVIFLQGGTFNMGATSNLGESEERPVHKVTIKDFAIGKYPVTFDEYDTFCENTGRNKANDQNWGRGLRPVINVSWRDASEYCEWLSAQTNQKYCLPTETQWEYAARAGSETNYFFGDHSKNLCEYAWYRSNSERSTHPVGEKKENPFGVYDIYGNIWEWTQDWYQNYSRHPTSSPIEQKLSKVCRGGSWNDPDKLCRSSFRRKWQPAHADHYLGFRIVRLI